MAKSTRRRSTADREIEEQEEGSAKAPLGTRIAARFARIGLTQDIPELRGQPPRPADFESMTIQLTEDQQQVDP